LEKVTRQAFCIYENHELSENPAKTRALEPFSGWHALCLLDFVTQIETSEFFVSPKETKGGDRETPAKSGDCAVNNNHSIKKRYAYANT